MQINLVVAGTAAAANTTTSSPEGAILHNTISISTSTSTEISFDMAMDLHARGRIPLIIRPVCNHRGAFLDIEGAIVGQP